jgi:hypothetical protein
MIDIDIDNVNPPILPLSKGRGRQGLPGFVLPLLTGGEDDEG